MTSIQKLWCGVVVAIVIAVAGLFTPAGSHVAGNILDTFSGDYFNATTGFQIAGVTIIGPTTFSLPSGVTSQTVNGVTQYFLHQTSLSTATTTPCVLSLPAATTTSESFSVNFTTASTTNKTVVLAVGKSAQASTTVIGQCNIAANGMGTCMATSTPVTGMQTLVFPPSGYLNVSMVGGAGVDSPVGSCSAIVDSI